MRRYLDTETSIRNKIIFDRHKVFVVFHLDIWEVFFIVVGKDRSLASNLYQFFLTPPTNDLRSGVTINPASKYF